MGVLVLITAVWLIDLINKQLGFFAALTLFMLCLIAKFIMENNKYFLSSKKVKLISLLIIIPLIYFIPFKVSNDESQLEKDIDKLWVSFDEKNIEKYVSENKVVILDVTADWCLTCKLNKLVNLDRISVLKLLESGKVIGMRADITKGTPEDVYKFMKKYNSFGIPLNIVFGPNAKQGIVLPVELFSSEVVDAVNKAY